MHNDPYRQAEPEMCDCKPRPGPGLACSRMVSPGCFHFSDAAAATDTQAKRKTMDQMVEAKPRSHANRHSVRNKDPETHRVREYKWQPKPTCG